MLTWARRCFRVRAADRAQGTGTGSSLSLCWPVSVPKPNIPNTKTCSFRVTEKVESYLALLFPNHDLSLHLISNQNAKDGPGRLAGGATIFGVGLPRGFFCTLILSPAGTNPSPEPGTSNRTVSHITDLDPSQPPAASHGQLVILFQHIALHNRARCQVRFPSPRSLI